MKLKINIVKSHLNLILELLITDVLREDASVNLD